MHLLCLSDEIGSDAVKMVIQLIQTDTFKPDVVSQHIKYWKECMEIVDGSVVQSLINDGFQNIDVLYKTDDTRKSFLYRRDVIEVLSAQLKIANRNYFMFRP